jgi:ComF family protein
MDIFIELLDLVLPRSLLDRKVDNLTFDILSTKLNARSANGVLTLLSYRDPVVRHMLWKLKYRGDSNIPYLCAPLIADMLIEKSAEINQFYPSMRIFLVPIPLSQKRLRMRGYNQAALLVQALHKHNSEIGTPLFECLLKTRETSPQTMLPRIKRLSNLKGAFTVSNPRHIQDSHIILLDDVTTTGTTLNEARDTLLAAGAHSVTMLALAH